MKTFNILLIDDHALFRSGLALILKGRFANATLLETETIEGALQDISVSPRFILLDHKLRGMQGVSGISLLKAKWPDCAIIIVSAIAESDIILDALNQGAVAYVPKTDSPEKITGMIEKLVQNGSFSPAEQINTLTVRQFEILQLLQTGLANKAIANKLDLSEFTVRGHVQAIIKTFNVTSRSAAVFEARKRGLLS